MASILSGYNSQVPQSATKSVSLASSGEELRTRGVCQPPASYDSGLKVEHSTYRTYIHGLASNILTPNKMLTGFSYRISSLQGSGAS